MTVNTEKFSLEMQGDCEIKNITEKISNILTKSKINNGIVTIFIKHTTASIMIIEDEAGLRKDTKTHRPTAATGSPGDSCNGSKCKSRTCKGA